MTPHIFGRGLEGDLDVEPIHRLDDEDGTRVGAMSGCSVHHLVQTFVGGRVLEGLGLGGQVQQRRRERRTGAGHGLVEALKGQIEMRV